MAPILSGSTLLVPTTLRTVISPSFSILLGSYNTAIGYNSLYSNTTGASSTAIGYNAGYNNSTGNWNTFLGFNAGYTDGTTATLGNLTNATAIGYNAQVRQSNSLILGGTGAYGVNVGIGTTSPYAKLSVVGEIVGAYFTGTTTATSTFGGNLAINGTGTTTSTGGFNISAGCFAIGGTCIGGGAGASTYLALTDTPSSFTASAIPYTNVGATALLHGANFIFDGTNLGIGTAAPASLLDITNSATSSAIISLRDPLGNVSLELRAGTSTLYNTFVGLSTGQVNTSGAQNTAIGYQSLYNNTAGSYNTANGLQSLLSNTTGFYSTANGYQSLALNTSGSGNTATGYFSLVSNTTGSFNTALGYKAGYNVTTGYDNIFLGHDQNTGGTAITTGFNNIGLGYNIKFPAVSSSNMLNVGNFLFANLPATTTNTSLTTQPLTGQLGVGTSSPYAKLTVWGADTLSTSRAFEVANSASTTLLSVMNNGYVGINRSGALASILDITNSATSSAAISLRDPLGGVSLELRAGTSTLNNTFIGYQSGQANTTGAGNTTNGYWSLPSNTTGSFNTVNGYSSLNANTTGSSNTANGYFSLSSNTTGSYNTALGHRSGSDVTTGYDNIFIGHDENLGGTAITTGYNNIGLGYNIKFPAVSSSNMLNVGNFLFANLPATTSATTIGNTPLTGLLGVGTSSPYAKLTVWGGDTLSTSRAFEVANSASTTLFSILNSGNVGIGTTSPWAKLSLQGTYGSQSTLFDIASSTNSSGSATTSLFTVLANGNVGIGTVSPLTTLHVNGPIIGNALILTSSSTAYSTLTSYGGFNGYVNASGGIGTGGNNSILNGERITAQGNLVNIGSIQAGELAISTGGTFLAAQNYTTGANPFAVAIGDVNGDGKADLAVANGGASTASVFINDGSGSFAAKVDYTTGSGPRSVAIGDVNGDGKADLATGNYNSGSGNTVSVLLNNGNGTFATNVDYTTGSGPISVKIGDLNSDGKADLIIANENNKVSVLINNGNGTFAAKVDYTTGSVPTDVAIGDVSGDGRVDIAVTNQNSDKVSVFINNGNGTFAAKVDYTTGVTPFGVAIGDVNGDGKADLAVANYSGPSVSVLLNTGSGAFAAKVDYTTGLASYDVAIGDVNGDGKADLAVANYSGPSVSVLLNTGSGAFAAKVDYTTGPGPSNVAIGDLNGDGKADLAVANSGIGTALSVFLNNTKTSFFVQGSTGNVAIGTSSPWAKLSVQGAYGSQIPLFDVASSTNSIGSATTSLFAILANGYVGIGTTSPYAKLSVVGEIVGAYFTATSTTATSTFTNAAFLPASGHSVQIGTSTISFAALTVVPIVGSNSAFSVNANNNGSEWFSVGLSGAGIVRFNSEGGSTLAGGAQDIARFNIGTLSAATHGLSVQGVSGQTGNLFMVDSNSSATTNDGSQFVIKGTGNVGVGTSSPWAKLSLQGVYGSQSKLFEIASSTNASGSATTSLFTVLSSGYTGIGTTSPMSLLSLSSTAGAAVFTVSNGTVIGHFGEHVTGATTLDIGTVGAHDVSLETNELTRMTISGSTGHVGIGTSSPWATLSVVDSDSTYALPMFVVASSTGVTNYPMFFVNATSTGALDYSRVAVGTTSPWGRAGLRDQFTVSGRIYQTWQYLSCDAPTTGLTGITIGTAVTAVTSHACGDFAFDLAGGTNAFIPSTGYPPYMILSANNSGTPTINGGTSIRSYAGIAVATSSPVLEARIRAPFQAGASASSTMYLIGFSDRTPATANYGTLPTNMIGFVATTTANWQAVINRAGTMTFADTGTPTTTTRNGFSRFRVEISSSTNIFLIDGTVVATIAPAAQVNVPMSPMVAVGKTSGGTTATSQVYLSYLRVWIDDPTDAAFQQDFFANLAPSIPAFSDDFHSGMGSGIWYRASTTPLMENMIASFSSGTSTGVVEPAYHGNIPVGVVSSQSNIYGKNTGDVPVVTSGSVQILLSLEDGAIMVGDGIAISSTTPGIGVRAINAGYIVGHAVEAFDPMNNIGNCVQGSTTTDCVGLITVEIGPSWSGGSVSIFQQITGVTTDITQAVADLASDAFVKGAQFTKLVIGKIVAETIVAKDFFAQVLNILPGGKVNVPSGANQIAGSATLPSGANTLFIPNTQVTEGTKIFITPRAMLATPIAVTGIDAGSGFTISVSSPSGNDVPFDWFMVSTYDTEGNTASAAQTQNTGTSQGGPTSASTNETSTTTTTVVLDGVASSTLPIDNSATPVFVDTGSSTPPADAALSSTGVGG